MGEVYKARDTRLDRDVAIKQLIAQQTQRFEQEARAVAALSHPNICQIHDVGPDYLVFEFVDGAPLAGPVPPREALRLAVQIAGALDAAHRRGILHRDLKPANILVAHGGSDQPVVKLLDFGLAKLLDSDIDATRTIEGTVIGTAAYMSPEQADGRPTDARSDIFSFGAVLHEVLSGRRAFGGKTTMQVLTAVMHEEPPLVAAPPAVREIVRRCLEKRPENRFQTAAELKVALERAAQSLGQRDVTEPTPSIAVLPFANLSADKNNEYFSDGLAEEIISALTHVPGLKVIARTSSFAFKGKEQDIRRIAEALGVTNIVEGSVRKAGSHIRVTAQLIAAVDGTHLWSARYDRELADMFAIQDEIAVSIADALRVTLRTARVTRRALTTSVLAYEAYLKARQWQWTGATGGVGPAASVRAKHYYEQALAHDPSFAACYVGLAHHFLVLATYNAMAIDAAMSGMRDAAQRALEIDPSLSEAHAMLGIVAGIYDFDWKEAEHRFMLAMEQKPIPADVHLWYGVFYLVPHGRAVEAIPHHRLALGDDPLNPSFRAALAEAFAASGQWAQSESTAQEIIDFDSSQTWPHLLIVWTYAARGRIADAIASFNRSVEPRTAEFPDSARSAYLQGNEVVRTALKNAALGDVQPSSWPGLAYAIAHMLMLRGAAVPAADWMKQSIADHHPMAARLLGWSCWKANPRYTELRRMMNLD
jgi:serine/threonine-protein kinase